MHIEKNVIDNIFYTIMDVKDKMKDNPKAWVDMKNIYKRALLELVEMSPKKFLKPKVIENYVPKPIISLLMVVLIIIIIYELLN